MGFWKAVGRAIGRRIESVGNIIGNKTMSNAGRKIQEACAEEVARERSYEKDKANIYDTERLNEILVSFSEGYYQQATAYEEACIIRVNNYFDNIISLLEDGDASDKIKNDVNLRRVKHSKSNIVKRINGAVKNPLAKRMSLDDAECLRILKMESGNAKKEAMTRFTQKIIGEALQNLSKQVREALDEQREWIEEYLVNLSEEQEKEFLNMQEQYTKMLESCTKEEKEREYHCITPLAVIKITETVDSLLV